MLTGRARRRGGQPGMSLLELLVAVALIAAVGALIIPAVKSRLDASHVSATIDNLNNVRAAITSYREDVGHYPSHLRQLQTKPGTGGTPATNICAAAVPAWSLDKWNGPYIATPIAASGINVAGIILADALVRDILDGEYLYVALTQLNSAMANEIDLAFDGAVGRLSGTIWYSPSNCTDLTCLVRFYIAISGC